MLGFVVVVAVSIFLLVGTPSCTETVVVVKIVVVKIVVVFTTVVIGAFMAGAQWGSALSRSDAASLMGSNLFALAVFALALWGRTPAGVLALAVLFAAQLLLDRRQQRLGLISAGYWQLRCTITPLVCTALVIYAWVAS